MASEYWTGLPDDLAEALLAVDDAGQAVLGSGTSLAQAVERLEAWLNDNAVCGVETFSGSRNPDSPNFGPDERCEEFAEVGSTTCKRHTGMGF